MARRMFSDEITTSDAFLDMPTESQNLYFHLGMNADDDGFISSPKMIQRATNASDDALKLLFVKKFLIQFPNGICVVKHWRINNQIRKDRYHETNYLKEKASLFIREDGAYSTNSEGAVPVPKGHFLLSGNQMATNGQPNGNRGKDSIGKDSEEKDIELPNWLNKEKWGEWLEHRKSLKKKMPATTIKKQLNFLESHIKDHIKIIDRSILMGWIGLFELPKDLNRSKSDAERILERQRKEDEERREGEKNAKENDNLRKLHEQTKDLANSMKA